MTTPQRSVRADGRRRLAQATVGMVVIGAAGVGVLAAHDAHASSGSRPTSNPSGDGTGQAELGDTGTYGDGTASGGELPSGSQGGSSAPFMLGGGTQSAPQATTGGS
jgi:hypothetical protein